MEHLNKVMANISGIIMGLLIFTVGILTFDDPSALFLKNIFVYGGLFVTAFFTFFNVREIVKTKDPNFGSVSAISRQTDDSKHAANAGKAFAFDLMGVMLGVLLLVSVALEAPAAVLMLTLGCYVAMQALAAFATARAYRQMRERRD